MAKAKVVKVVCPQEAWLREATLCVLDAPGTHPAPFCCLPAHSGEAESAQLQCYMEALCVLDTPCTSPHSLSLPP